MTFRTPRRVFRSRPEEEQSKQMPIGSAIDSADRQRVVGNTHSPFDHTGSAAYRLRDGSPKPLDTGSRMPKMPSASNRRSRRPHAYTY